MQLMRLLAQLLGRIDEKLRKPTHLACPNWDTFCGRPLEKVENRAYDTVSYTGGRSWCIGCKIRLYLQ